MWNPHDQAIILEARGRTLAAEGVGRERDEEYWLSGGPGWFSAAPQWPLVVW